MTTILTDNAHYMAIASAIRDKNGLSASYTPSEMAGAISAIPTGGGSAVLGSKSITANGTYFAQADSLDGYSSVMVNVQPVLSSAEFTANGSYQTPSGYDGFANVVVNVDGGGGGDVDAVIERTIVSIVNSTASIVASYLFVGSPLLEYVEMASVISIGFNAFSSCTNLETAVFSKCETIGTNAFQNCRSLAQISFPECTSIMTSAFNGCSHLTEASFPLCVNVGSSAFRDSPIVNVSLPMCSFIGSSAFMNCSPINTVYLPLVENIGYGAFSNCSNLSEIALPNVKKINGDAFCSCFMLVSLDLTGVQSVPSLATVNAFYSTPLYNYSAKAGGWGSIYVPASLYDAFISARNWSSASIAARIVSVESE